MKKPSKKLIITITILVLVAVAGFSYYAWQKAEQQRKATEFHQNIQKRLKDKGLPVAPSIFGER